VDESGKIAPQELRHPDFSTRLRGYDKGEVDRFLAAVADHMEQEAEQKSAFMQKISLLEKQLLEFRNLENTLKNTLLRSQETADDIKRTAEKEGALIVREAQVKADRLLEEKRAQINQLEAKYQALQSRLDEYFIRFKNMLTSQLETLKRMEEEHKALVRIDPAGEQAKTQAEEEGRL